MWRVCSDNGWWSRFGNKRRYAKAKAGTPAHDDLVRRRVHAEGPNQLWLADITEHRIAIVTWIERTYHRRRRQAALGRLTPIEYETIMTPLNVQAA